MAEAILRHLSATNIFDLREVIAVVTDLVNGVIEWPEACNRLPRYTGTQNVE